MNNSANYFLHNKRSDYIIKGELIRDEKLSYSSNRNYKDTVFRLLMDDEAHLLELFNALEGTDYGKQSLVHINTLKGAIFNKTRNDLSFSIEDWYLSVVEHQSSITENSPLRMCLYLSRVWEQVLDIAKAYRRKLYRIPMPKAYLLYNGQEDFPQEKLYLLSDAFRSLGCKPPMELAVRAININQDKNHPILEKCSVLNEYSIFIARIRSKLAEGMNRDAAVKEAIRECIDERVLGDFLNRHGREVYNMMFDEITYEDILRIRLEEAEEEAIEKGLLRGLKQGIKQGVEQGLEEGMEQGIEQGLKQGIQQGKAQGEQNRTKAFVRNLLRTGIPDAQICTLAECDLRLIEDVRKSS